MNERIRKIAEEAGFIFWGNESWKPEGAVIDWASDYDQEFAKFTELMIRECVAHLMSNQDMTWQQNYLGGWHDAALHLENHFGVE